MLCHTFGSCAKSKLEKENAALAARVERLTDALEEAFDWLPQRTDLEDPDDVRDFNRFIKQARKALKP